MNSPPVKGSAVVDGIEGKHVKITGRIEMYKDKPIVCGYVTLVIRDSKKLFPELIDPRLVRLEELWSITDRWSQ